MGETTHQIETHIADTREKLGENVRELERKVKSVTDWKQHVRTSPMTMLGVAFGGGILLATMVGRSKTSKSEPRGFSTDAASQDFLRANGQRDKVLETWNNIKGALIGVAATRFKDFVGEVIPGFQEQFARSEENTKTDVETATQTV